MTMIVLAGAAGAPGVTLTALGISLTWPEDVLLVDADRTPSQSVLAGYLRGQREPGAGLLGVSQAHRELRDLGEAITRLRIPLPSPPSKMPQPEVARHFLPGFSHLQAIDSFVPVWGPLAGSLRAAPFDTIVDVGRVGRDGLPDELVETAHQVAVVTRTSLRALAALRLYLPPLVDQVGAGRVGLILVGVGRPYSAREIEDQFGVPVLAEIDWQPTAAEELADGLPLSHRWAQQSLGRSYAQAARSFTLFDQSLQAEVPA